MVLGMLLLNIKEGNRFIKNSLRNGLMESQQEARNAGLSRY